jgi:hypothetical protein
LEFLSFVAFRFVLVIGIQITVLAHFLCVSHFFRVRTFCGQGRASKAMVAMVTHALCIMLEVGMWAPIDNLNLSPGQLNLTDNSFKVLDTL